MKQYHTVNCYSNSFADRTVDARNSLPASAFNCESVSGFKHFLWWLCFIENNVYVSRF